MWNLVHLVANEVLEYHSYSYSSVAHVYFSIKIAKEVIHLNHAYLSNNVVLLCEQSRFSARSYVRPGMIEKTYKIECWFFILE